MTNNKNNTARKIPEILSPAGNPEKLRFAVSYGADAVYLALKDFGMRAYTDNFTPDEFREGVAFAHSHGAKVYLTLNTMPSETKLAALPSLLESVADCIPDAFIISDPGVMLTVRKRFPEAVIHLSTQASTVNSAGCRFWYSNGVSRIVLARELTLVDIASVKKNIPGELELEAFVHGAMCISYSGRCLLSNYFTGRNANEGGCAQPCRWKYHIHEEKRGEDIFSAEEYSEGTYIFSSKDTCMIEHIAAMADAGIDSFKIEGRMKSAYYTACVTNAYKMALADALEGKPFDKAYLSEVNGVSHREYNTGFYFGSPSEGANTVSNPGYLCEAPFYCSVMSYDGETKLARCYQRNKMQLGCRAQLLTPGHTGKDIEITELFDTDMNPIEATPHPKMEFFVRLPDAKPGDIIRGKVCDA